MKIRLFLALAVLILCSATPTLAQLKVGDQAPDFSAYTLDDLTIKLSDLKGKKLLIEMGTTWCPSCNEMAHQIDGLRDYLKEQGVTFVSVYLADSAEGIREHIAEENLEPADTTMIDSGEARTNYSVFSIPRLLLIDENFKILFDEMALSGKQIRKRIESHRSRD